MSKRVVTSWILFGLLLLAACRQQPAPLPTPLPPAPTEQTPAQPQATLLPEEATDAPATAAPGETEAPAAATATPAPAETAAATTEAVTPTTEAAAATPTITPPAVADGELLAPGQRAAGMLSADSADTFPFAATRFQSQLFFLETADDLDAALQIYPGEAPVGGEPAAEASQSSAGGPEIWVFTPQETGPHTAVVEAAAGEGAYALYLFDAATAAPQAAVQQSGTLAAGETNSYAATSRGGRPVIVFVDPTDQSDLSIEVRNAAGETVADANFAGAGSAEALYVLPRQTTEYTVRIAEASGAPSNYNIKIITLADQE